MYSYRNINNSRKALAALALVVFMLAAACSGDYEEAKTKPASELKAKLVYYSLPG